MRIARTLKVVAVLGVAATMALTACTQKSQSGGGRTAARAAGGGGPVKVAFVPKLQGVPYFEAMNAGGQKAAAALGNVQWLYQGPTTGRRRRAGRHRALVHPAEGQHADRGAERPRLDGAAAGQEAKAQGIHVATADTDAPNSVREAFVNQATARGHRRVADRRAAQADGRPGQVRDRVLRADGREPELLDQGPEGVHGRRSTRRRRSSTPCTRARTRPRPPRWRPT